MECPICYNKITKRFQVITECKHMFCNKCMNKWSSVSDNCPLCRSLLGFEEHLNKHMQIVIFYKKNKLTLPVDIYNAHFNNYDIIDIIFK